MRPGLVPRKSEGPFSSAIHDVDQQASQVRSDQLRTLNQLRTLAQTFLSGSQTPAGRRFALSPLYYRYPHWRKNISKTPSDRCSTRASPAGLTPVGFRTSSSGSYRMPPVDLTFCFDRSPKLHRQRHCYQALLVVSLDRPETVPRRRFEWLAEFSSSRVQEFRQLKRLPLIDNDLRRGPGRESSSMRYTNGFFAAARSFSTA